MNAFAITLDVLDAAVVHTLPDASPAEQGSLLAELIRKFDVELTPTLTPKPAPGAQPKVRWRVSESGLALGHVTNM